MTLEINSVSRKIMYTHLKVNKLHNDWADVFNTVSNSVFVKVVFKFSVQSLPTVPFSLKTTYPSFTYPGAWGVSRLRFFDEFMLLARLTGQNQQIIIIYLLQKNYFSNKKKALQQFISSLPFGQSLFPSHLFDTGMQCLPTPQWR